MARLRPSTTAIALLVLAIAVLHAPARAQDDASPGNAFSGDASPGVEARLDRLEAEIEAAEDVSAIKRLQHAYGYYLDEGMWADLAELFTDDAVANYPAGVYVGKPSITRHLYLNVGGGEMGEIGLGDGRLYNHMSLQPVVHLDPDGRSAKGRWRVLAMFGNFGGGAVWAEGIYNVTYAKVGGVWKIRTLDYHAGFGAPYDTGWAAPQEERPRTPRQLAHPPDRERNMPCEGFPEACIAPFHYENPGRGSGGAVWAIGEEALERHARSTTEREQYLERLNALARRADRLQAEQQIENLQKIFGYYFDRRLWDDVADLFADDGTIEMAQRGVYVGRERIREFLELLGPQGLRDGELNDHAQLQPIVTVAPDGRTARLRARTLAMTGEYQSHGEWSEGIYENTFVREDGVWKFKSLRYYPTFITDYDEGWARDAKPAPGVSGELPPDRPPSVRYEIYPKAHVPPYHYPNPVTGEAPQYPQGEGRPSDEAVRAATAPVAADAESPAGAAEGSDRSRGSVGTIDVAAVEEVARRVQRVKDHHEIENLENAYGYYLDKNLWNDLADLVAEEGSMELAQRGVYHGRERVRGFLFAAFGPEGPVQGRLGNHVQMQQVVHISPDGNSARIRARMLQQLSFGGRPSLGSAVYENEAVKEDGVWKFSRVHAYNTWTASYDGGWARSPGRRVPGPSEDYPPDAPPSFQFDMFPTVYEIPFHYVNPVSGRPPAVLDGRPESSNGGGGASVRASSEPAAAAGTARPAAAPAGMPSDVAAALREIGPRIAPPETAALYAPLHPDAPDPAVEVSRDVRYGPHERNVLDVFTAPGADAARPVVVFVHGGGFTRGAKSAPDSPFYDNIMRWAVLSGFVGININYRLAPEHVWPSGIEDLRALTGWLERNAAGYGGDAGRVVLWGHSAGAAHVADYLADAANSGRDPRAAGAVLTSGFYDLGDQVSVWEAYYGNDVSTYGERSSLPGLLRSDVPLLVTDAELDPESFRVEADKLTDARAEAGNPVRRVHLPNHSHLSETYAVGTPDRSLSVPVAEFVRDVTR